MTILSEEMINIIDKLSKRKKSNDENSAFWKTYQIIVSTDTFDTPVLDRIDLWNLSSFYLDLYSKTLDCFWEIPTLILEALPNALKLPQDINPEDVTAFKILSYLDCAFFLIVGLVSYLFAAALMVLLTALAVVAIIVEIIKMTVGVVLGSFTQMLQTLGAPDMVLDTIRYGLRAIPWIASIVNLPLLIISVGMGEGKSSQNENSDRNYGQGPPNI